MLPGDTWKMTIGIQTPSGVAAGAGVVVGDLSVRGYVNGAVAALAPALTFIETIGAWSQYRLDIVLPALSVDAVTWFKAVLLPVVPTAYALDRLAAEVEIETADLGLLYSIAAVPVISVISAGGPVGDISVRVVKADYAVVSFTVRDQSGAAIDLSGYTTPQFGVKDQLQATTYLQTAGITMTAGGLVTIAIPEGASFYALLLTGVDQIGLFFSFNADQGGDATKTRTLARGPLTVVRKET